MKAKRNVLILFGFLLFGIGYGGIWAYRTQYKAPREQLRKEIEQYAAVNGQMETLITQMQQFVQANRSYYTRSFPRQRNAARGLYQQWLYELAKYCEMEDIRLDPYNPTYAAFGISYRFHLEGRISSQGLARLLFEFYGAPFLHRILSFQIRPLENSEMMRLDMEFQGNALYPLAPRDPYPLMDKLPQGTFHRLALPTFADYEPYAEQSLLRYARSGLDKADFTYITAVLFTDGVPTLWLTDRTSAREQPIEVKLNEKVQIGSFAATLVQAPEENVLLFERDGQYWLLANGECLNQAFAVPPEAVMISQ